jgi:hypothetical protein
MVKFYVYCTRYGEGMTMHPTILTSYFFVLPLGMHGCIPAADTLTCMHADNPTSRHFPLPGNSPPTNLTIQNHGFVGGAGWFSGGTPPDPLGPLRGGLGCVLVVCGVRHL